MKQVSLLIALVAAVAVAAEFFPARDVSADGFGAMRDGSMELAADTPVRQAQRARHRERNGDFEAEGVSLMETSAQRLHDPNGPALNRLTGASKTFHPNDQMCVMCQFLVQRTQLDMAHFNVLGGFQKIKAAGAGGAANAAAGGADAGEKSAGDESSFLEMATEFAADDASQDWADEDAEEAAAMEIAAKEALAEQDGDWNAVEALEQKAHAIDTVVLEMDAEEAALKGDEDAEEMEEGEEVAEGEEFEEEDEEHALSHELAASSFAETDTAVVTAGLTAQEQREMADVMTEMRDERVQSSVDKELADGFAATPVLVETHSDAEEEEATEDESEDESEAESADESEMHADEVEVSADSIANSDRSEFVDALGASFDSELNLSADERQDMASMLTGKDSAADPAWGSPLYNADGHAEQDTEVVSTEALDADSNEDLALLQVDETESDSDESEDEEGADAEEREEAERDAAQDEEMEGIADGVEFVETNSGVVGPRSYARTLHVAESEPVQPLMAEVSGQHASFQSAGGLARVDRRCSLRMQKLKRCKKIHGTTKKRCQLIKRKVAPPTCTYGQKTIGISNSPRRFRLADAIASRPRWNRWDPTVKPHPDANRAKAREMWHHLMQMTYDRLEGYCSTRLPEQFTPFCRPLLRRFRVVAEGIRYGDRPNQICMRTRFCPRGSYVRRSPHNVFKHMKVCRGPSCADLGVPLN